MTFQSAKLGTFSGRRSLYAAVASLFSNGQVQGIPNPDFSLPLTSTVIASGFGAPSFTRATTRTVTDHEGKVNTLLSGEVGFQGARRVQNLLTQTESFGVDWISSVGGTGSAAVKTPNYGSIAAPDGTFTACRVQVDVGAGNNNNATNISFLVDTGWGLAAVTQTYRRSVWLRTVDGSTKTVSLKLNSYSGTSDTVTIDGTWRRYSPANFTGISGANSFGFGIRGDAGSTCSATIDMLVWHPQIEDVTGQQNQNPGEYVSVGAAKLNDFLNTEILNTTNGWSFSSAVGSSTTVVAYDGRAVGAKVDETVATSTHVIFKTVAKPSSAVYTYGLQFDLKAGERTWGFVRIDDTVANGMVVYFDLTNGVMGSNAAIGTGFSVISRSMRSLGNGWYRCFASIQTNSTANINPQCGPATGDLQSTYTGVAANGINVAYPNVSLGVTAEMSYFPVGNVYSYNGSAVDGVKCFETYNGNTVTSNVVTAGVGRTIGQTKNQSAYLPGIASTKFQTPDSPASRVTGDIDVRAFVALVSWASGATQGVLRKWYNSVPAVTRNYELRVDSAGTLGFISTADGVTQRIATSSVATGFAAGTAHWIRATRVAATGTVTFYTSDDGLTWTQLGTTVATTAGGIVSSDGVVDVGVSGAGGDFYMVGTIYQACVYNGIGGTLAVCFTANDWTSGGTFVSSSTGETWALNNGAKINNFPLAGYVPDLQGTNLCLQSEDFSTTWTLIGTPTRTAAALRCGSVVLDLIGDDDAAANEAYAQVIPFTVDAVKAISVFFAQGTSTSSAVQLLDTTAVISRLIAVITWAAGVPTVTMTVGTLLGVDALANGVFRARFATTAVTTANSNSLRIVPATDAAFTVTGVGNAYFGGVMAQSAIECTPYVKTTTVSVTSNPDQLTYPSVGNALTALGTMTIDAVTNRPSSSIAGLVSLNDGTTNNRVDLRQQVASSSTVSVVSSGGVAQATPSDPGSVTSGLRYRTAVRWNTNDVQITRNGALGVQDVVATMPVTFTQIQVGGLDAASGLQLGGPIRNLRIWKTALSDQQLKDLTK
jgi:hypothetical protein